MKGYIQADFLQRKKGKESVGYTIEEELIEIVNSIPGHDPATQQLYLQLNGKPFAFEVDSGAKDNLCSTLVWMKLGESDTTA